MKKNAIVVKEGYAFLKWQKKSSKNGNWIPALYRQYEVGGFEFQVEIFNKYAIIQHIYLAEDWSKDFVHNRSNIALLDAKGHLMDFLLNIPSIVGVYEKFTPVVED